MIANTETTVKPKAPRFGRHPLDVVKRMVQAKLGRNQMAIYLALGEPLINKSNPTVSDCSPEFVQVRPAMTKYN